MPILYPFQAQDPTSITTTSKQLLSCIHYPHISPSAYCSIFYCAKHLGCPLPSGLLRLPSICSVTCDYIAICGKIWEDCEEVNFEHLVSWRTDIAPPGEQRSRTRNAIHQVPETEASESCWSQTFGEFDLIHHPSLNHVTKPLWVLYG